MEYYFIIHLKYKSMSPKWYLSIASEWRNQVRGTECPQSIMYVCPMYSIPSQPWDHSPMSSYFLGPHRSRATLYLQLFSANDLIMGGQIESEVWFNQRSDLSVSLFLLSLCRGGYSNCSFNSALSSLFIVFLAFFHTPRHSASLINPPPFDFFLFRQTTYFALAYSNDS